MACLCVEGTCATEAVTLEVWLWATGVTSVIGRCFISDNMVSDCDLSRTNMRSTEQPHV